MSICKIARISLPEEERASFEESFAYRRGMVELAPGFLGMTLLRPHEGTGTEDYYLLTFWENDDAYRSWRDRAKHGRRQEDDVRHAFDESSYTQFTFDVIEQATPIQ